MHDNQPREHRRLQCRVQCRVLRRNADCDLTEKDPVISNSGGNCSSRNDGDRRFTHQRIFIQIFTSLMFVHRFGSSVAGWKWLDSRCVPQLPLTRWFGESLMLTHRNWTCSLDVKCSSPSCPFKSLNTHCSSHTLIQIDVLIRTLRPLSVSC